MTPRGDAITSMAGDDYAVFIAIDWGDKKHVWGLQKAGSRDRQQGEIEARPEAVETWVSGLLARFPGQRIAVALEQKQGALLCQLSKYESLSLYRVTPGQVSRCRPLLVR